MAWSPRQRYVTIALLESIPSAATDVAQIASKSRRDGCVLRLEALALVVEIARSILLTARPATTAIETAWMVAVRPVR
jgi:hypothetical protein